MHNIFMITVDLKHNEKAFNSIIMMLKDLIEPHLEYGMYDERTYTAISTLYNFSLNTTLTNGKKPVYTYNDIFLVLAAVALINQKLADEKSGLIYHLCEALITLIEDNILPDINANLNAIMPEQKVEFHNTFNYHGYGYSKEDDEESLPF